MNNQCTAIRWSDLLDSSVAAVTVFGGFNPILEPGLSPNLTGPNRAINIGSTTASRGLALVPKPAQTTFKRLYTIYDGQLRFFTPALE
jgi:hypothetical protein